MKEPLLRPDFEKDSALWLWIGAATRGLAEDSRHRVGDEIAQHFCDAAEERMAAGLSESDARAEALRDLGSHEVARRAFRRAYLTSSQEKLVRDHFGRSRSVSVLWSVLLVLGTIFVATMPDSRTRWLVAAAIIGGMAGSLAIRSLISPWLRERGRPKTAVALGAFADWCFWFALLFGTNYLGGARNLMHYGVLFAASFLVLLALYLPVLRKLNNLPTRPA